MESELDKKEGGLEGQKKIDRINSLQVYWRAAGIKSFLDGGRYAERSVEDDQVRKEKGSLLIVMTIPGNIRGGGQWKQERPRPLQG